jgi:hypothetical protein
LNLHFCDAQLDAFSETSVLDADIESGFIVGPVWAMHRQIPAVSAVDYRASLAVAGAANADFHPYNRRFKCHRHRC